MRPGEPVYQKKSYALRGDIEDNVLKGGASVMGTCDMGRDVVFPGAFKTSLPAFMKKGFVSDTHEWTWESMLAMPMMAEERGNQLYTEAVFHSTPRAQDARTIAKERLARGLNVGLSIGYMPSAKGTLIFDSGQELLAYAKDNNYALDLFDVKGLRADKRPMRGLTDMAELIEYSIVPSPMNPLATATEAKNSSRVWAFPEYTSRKGVLPIPDDATDAQIGAVVRSLWYPQGEAQMAGAAGPVVGEAGSAVTTERKQATVSTWRGEVDVADFFDDCEEDAALATLDSLTQSLWSVFYAVLRGPDEGEPSLDDQIAAIEEALGIFGERAVTLVRAILATEPPEQAEMAKAFRDLFETKTASGSTSLPLASRDRAWDGPAAEKRVRDWAGATDAPNAKYAKAFFHVDDDRTKFGSYHLGFADVVDGTLTAIPRGIFAAAGAVQGARGADGEKYADAKPKIARYYARMRKAFNDETIKVPWDSGKSLSLDIDAITSARTLEDALRDAGMSKSVAEGLIGKMKRVLRGEPGGQGAEGEPPAQSTSTASATAAPSHTEPPKRVYKF